jgi:hypothetical protein
MSSDGIAEQLITTRSFSERELAERTMSRGPKGFLEVIAGAFEAGQTI